MTEFKLTFDVDAPLKALAEGERAMMSVAVPALNVAATETRLKLIGAVAADTDVPEEFVADALVLRSASTVRSEATIAAYDRLAAHVRWITRQDERVCEICGPRHNVVYSVDEVPETHHGCRCTLEPVSVAESAVRLAPPILQDRMTTLAEFMTTSFARGFGS